MSRLPVPSTTRKSVTRSMTKATAPRVKTTDAPIARVRPSTSQTQGPTLLQKRVFKEALSKSALDPKKKVVAVGAQRTSIRPPTVTTKKGKEPVLQQLTVEKTIQRTPRAEYIAKTMKGVDVNPRRGKASRIEMTSQQIDPAHATESSGVNVTVSTTSSVTVTPSGKHMKKSFSKRTVKELRLLNKANMNPAHVSRLIKEETEDVETTLKMVPPDLASTSLEKYPLKRKVQNLRLNSESIALLEQSLIHQAPTADEVETETPPEVMASVIHAVEKGASPDSAPNQIFNSLFPEVQTANTVKVSSVAPGPLLDLVVPIGEAPSMTEEMLGEDMEKTLTEVQARQKLPSADFCTENNIRAPPRQDQGEKKVPTTLEDEIPPWEDANVQKIYALVGSEPIDLLNATDTSILDQSQDLTEELSKGIDCFIDANINPYETKVQIRGSRPPCWFPGYMAAFPHYPEVVRLSKSPSGVLHSAWKAVQPKIFPEDSLLIA